MERETKDVIVSITNAMRYMDPVLKLTSIGTVMLLQHFARLIQERRLQENTFEEFSDFLKATDGKYDIMNVPIADAEQMSEELDAMGVHHSVLPDLNKDDGLVQVAVYQADKDKFAAWYQRHLMSCMQGGEKSLQDLQNLTRGRTSIVSFPLEGMEQDMAEDFSKLGINYSMLPDLHVGDGSFQMVVANADMPKVQKWYDLKKEDLLKTEGRELPDLDAISMEEYQQTGQITEEEYVESASPDIKKAIEKYENQEKGELEETLAEPEQYPKNENVIEFESFSRNPEYIPISIDRETLIQQSSYQDLEEFQRHGMFACRVPGTWNTEEMEEQILLIRMEQVFETNDGKGYLAFLRKTDPPIVLSGKTGDVMEQYAGIGSDAFARNYFEKVQQKMLEIDQKKSKELEKAVTKAGKEVLPLKIPSNPVKAR
ncbi:MAG: hypothetical protein Q4E53_07040 [Eubacteriales bacterium]|nr:hypothetical protein [Eubacteriales bacterium]